MKRASIPALLLLLSAASAGAQQPPPPQILDISGIYNRNNMITEDRAILINAVGGGAKIGDYTGFPLNEAGRQWADSWMAARLEMPEHQCHPHPTQYSMWGPGNFRISNVYEEQTDRIVAIRIQGTFGRADRIVWLDGRPHPPDWARHTWAGFSTGRWDGNQLTIETTHLKEGWFARNGITSSDQTTMREHWIKHDNYLTIVFIINDPEHLEEPFIRTTQAVLDPTTILNAQECQPFNTTVMNPGHARDYVPHWLPGQNPQVAEFAEKYGVPADAARGGAKTIYPEYLAEIKKWVATRGSAPRRPTSSN
jgi:hypothetical protein